MLTAEKTRVSKSILKHRELSDLLRGRIESGQYQAGKQIPTEHELAEAFDVSRNTIRQAMATLEDQGYLIRRRGAGTFVGEISCKGRPITPLTKMGYLLVDLPNEADQWALRMTRAAHRWLAPRDIHLSIQYVQTEDLLTNGRPCIPDIDDCQAVLVDGWVQAIHCSLLERMQKPYLVIGNRHVGQHPQVRYQVERMAARATQYLHELRPTQPVVLCVEPFRYHTTLDLFRGYASATRSLPQGHPILQPVDDVAVDSSLERLMSMYSGPFSLLTMDSMWAHLAVEYRRHQLPVDQWPVLVIGDTGYFSRRDRERCYTMAFDNRLIESALPAFVEAYANGSTRDLRINVDVTQIDPPSTAGPQSPTLERDAQPVPYQGATHEA